MEHFVPIRKAELVEFLCGEPGLAMRDRELLRQLARLLDVTLHLELHQRLEELSDLYSHFDPDADTIPPIAIGPEQRQAQLERLFERFDQLLGQANFVKLSREDVRQATHHHSTLGLDMAVDFDVFERLEIYARGDVTVERLKRGWRGRWRREHVIVPIYQRLVIIFRLQARERLGRFTDTDDVYMKVFKDIPKLDLEMLLPGTRVKMTLLDRARSCCPRCRASAWPSGRSCRERCWRRRSASMACWR